jgi:hypothetical protein
MMHHVFLSICHAIPSAILVVGLASTVAACGSEASPAQRDLESGGPTAPSRLAERRSVLVTRVRVFMNEGRPHAYVEGELGDGCTSLEHITQQRIRNALTMTLTSVRHGDVCTQMMQGLNALVALDGPFAPGVYSVRANGATARFRLVASAGGELRLDPDPGPPPQFPPAVQ